ncbi:MAG: PIN domain-containing protein, partial [Thermoflexales bacterium]|nr:PIN domain-containing protein [Thermoflexales bacterium]
MNRAYVDANVILRFLTSDPPDMAEQAAALFERVEQENLRLVLDPIVLAEVVWVLQSFYRYRPAEIAP